MLFIKLCIKCIGKQRGDFVIGIASDHAGYEVKQKIIDFLEKNNYKVIDYGTNSTDSVDYPNYAFKIGTDVVNKKIEKGILICKTGIGMSIACNKVKGIRCSKVDTKEEAYLTRFHNDSNVLAISAMKELSEIEEIIKIYLETPFSNEEKHLRRIKEICDYER